MSKETTPQLGNNEEVDLGQLFRLIGNAFDKLFRFIKSIFKGLFNLLMLSLIFTQKHYIKFVIAGVIGLALGFYLEKQRGVLYESKMIVEPNFFSTNQLYNNINFYNTLAQEKDTLNLSRVFNLSKLEEAGSIFGVNIEPYVNENIKIQQFNEFVTRLDTTTIKSVTYEDYLKNYDDLSARYHEITFKSSNKLVAKKVESLIVESIDYNDYFKLQKEVSDKNIEITDNILNEQLISLDTLQEVYKKVLVESAKVQNLGTSINLADGNNSQNKELQLLAKREFVKDEITDLNLERARRNKTINIISDFPDSGAKVGGLANNLKIRYAILFIGFTILILLLLELNKFVKSYKKEKDH
jgi:hypothetical protein